MTAFTAAARAAAAAALASEDSLPRDARFEAFWASLWIPGWLDKPQASILYHLACHGPGAGEVVEIGSYLGRSTAVLAAAVRDRGTGKVTAVDPHEGNRGLPGTESSELSTYPLFLHHLEQYGLHPFVSALQMTSVTAAQIWERPVRLLYLDGLHTEDAVYADLAAWGPHLERTGVIVFDDYDYFEGIANGVRAALADAVVSGELRRISSTVLLGELPEPLRDISRPVAPGRFGRTTRATGP